MNPDNIGAKIEAGQEQEISPETVEVIESSAFSLTDRVAILLTKAGLKPASWVDLDVCVDSSGKQIDLSFEDIEKNRSLLKRLFLLEEQNPVSREQETKDGQKDTVHHFAFMIGLTREKLERLSRAVKNNDKHEIGLSLGFCETAADAFCGNGEILNFEELPDEVQRNEAAAFNPGKLSRTHWQEELAQYQRWADYVKGKSPNLYNQMMGI